MVGVSRFLFVRWIAWWCSKWWKARFEWVLVCIGWREKRGGPLLAECCYCIPCSRKDKGFIPLALSTHTLSLRGNFRISFAACVQTVVCKIWKIILTKKGDSSFSPDFCQIKKDDLLVANRLSFLRVPGLEPGAVYRPDVPNSYKKANWGTSSRKWACPFAHKGSSFSPVCIKMRIVIWCCFV